jgi:hypothetical protein
MSMAAPDRTVPPYELLGVFADRETADRVVEAVRRRVPGSDGRVGNAEDYVDAMKAETVRDSEDSIIANGALVMSKEGSKSVFAFIPVAAAIGVLLALPIAWFALPDTAVWLRLVIALAVGAVGGGTIGWIAGMGLGVIGPDPQLAAQRGVTARVWPDSEETRSVLLAGKPLRLDVLDATGLAVDTLTTERELTDTGIKEQLELRATNPTDQWHSADARDPRHGRGVPGQDVATDVPDPANPRVG